jgi:hypothetical protein
MTSGTIDTPGRRQDAASARQATLTLAVSNAPHRASLGYFWPVCLLQFCGGQFSDSDFSLLEAAYTNLEGKNWAAQVLGRKDNTRYLSSGEHLPLYVYTQRFGELQWPSACRSRKRGPGKLERHHHCYETVPAACIPKGHQARIWITMQLSPGITAREFDDGGALGVR